MRRALGNLALLVTTLLLLGGAGEALLRLLPQPNDRHEKHGRVRVRFNPYRPDGHLGFALRPSWQTVHETRDYRVSVHTNALGLRGREIAARKPSGTQRILVLGDSFAFGFGVADDETFAARLEVLLSHARRGRAPVQVLNAGVPGWSTDQHWIFLRRRGFALDPDLVLLATMENDVGDLAGHRLRLDGERLPLRVESLRRTIDARGRMRYLKGSPWAPPSWDFPGRDWLADHSALYAWLRFRALRAWVRWAPRLRAAARPPRSTPAAPIPELAPETIGRGLAGDPGFRLRYHRYLVAALERACQRRGIRVAFLLAANRDSDPPPGSPEKALHADCAARGARCLDSSRLFPRGRSQDAFFPYDGHWNATGHARVARALRARIAALLP